mmetsp:Transcript_15751/g.26572  ORF Transcript_15751/g.26572 Transcript_15751/m.26572 type:complete len:296 (-) Transcript_15751:487-1374(-)
MSALNFELSRDITSCISKRFQSYRTQLSIWLKKASKSSRSWSRIPMMWLRRAILCFFRSAPIFACTAPSRERMSSRLFSISFCSDFLKSSLLTELRGTTGCSRWLVSRHLVQIFSWHFRQNRMNSCTCCPHLSAASPRFPRQKGCASESRGFGIGTCSEKRRVMSSTSRLDCSAGPPDRPPECWLRKVCGCEAELASADCARVFERAAPCLRPPVERSWASGSWLSELPSAKLGAMLWRWSCTGDSESAGLRKECGESSRGCLLWDWAVSWLSDISLRRDCWWAYCRLWTSSWAS